MSSSDTVDYVAAIDDNDLDLMFLERTLSKQDYSFKAFTSVSLFMKHVHSTGQLPKLILLDYYLPGSTVSENLQVLNSLFVPILVVSGESRPQAIDLTIQEGAKGFICKDDLTPEYLLERVNKVFETSSPSSHAHYRELVKLLVVGCHILNLPDQIGEISRLVAHLDDPAMSEETTEKLKLDLQRICGEIMAQTELTFEQASRLDSNFSKLTELLIGVKADFEQFEQGYLLQPQDILRKTFEPI